MKRMISLVLTFVIVLSTVSFVTIFGEKVEAASYGSFAYTETSSAIKIIKYNGTDGAVTIPDIINGKPVTGIGDYAFSDCLTGINIPSSIISIGEGAFFNCTNLTNINVDVSNSSYSSIGGILFNKEGTTLIKYPNGINGAYSISSSVTSIGNWAFGECTGLTNITIPSNVTNIGVGAFYRCVSLIGITIPSSVTSIANLAFEYCAGLTSITIPSSVTSIGEGAFYGCTGLIGIAIPSSVTSIGEGAFYGCTGLTGITIPSSVTSIGNSAFELCTGITGITIPSNVTSIGEGAFSFCTNLININVDVSNSSYSSIGGVLFNKDGTVLIQYPRGINGAYSIPNSVTSIGNYAFGCCADLTGITIPNSVTSIGDYAFLYCGSLKSIIIPDSVTSIGHYGFYGCNDLVSITIPSSVISIDNHAFYNCNNLMINTYRGSFAESFAIANSIPVSYIETPTPVPQPTIPAGNIDINNAGTITNPYSKTGASIARIDVTGIIDPTTDNKVVMVKGVEARYTYYNGLYKFVALVDGSVATSDVTVTDGTPTKLIYADIGLNGTTEATDVNLLKGAVAGNRTATNDFELLASDVNGDGFVNATDYNTLKGFIAGNLTILPVYSK